MFAGAFLFLVGGITLISASSDDSPKIGEYEKMSRTYNADMKTAVGYDETEYNVRISEVDRGYGVRRLVHLTPIGAPSYIGITGHDYDSDGEWDRVFYCGYGTDSEGGMTGCNSVIRQEARWKFEPCAGDEGKAKPFTLPEIEYAITELDAAVETTRTLENLTRLSYWDPEEERVVSVDGLMPRV